MANPNKTVANFRRQIGPDPKAVEARKARFEQSPMKDIMDKVQSGEITAAEGIKAIENISS